MWNIEIENPKWECEKTQNEMTYYQRNMIGYTYEHPLTCSHPNVSRLESPQKHVKARCLLHSVQPSWPGYEVLDGLIYLESIRRT